MKYKFFGLSIIAVALISFLFIVTQIPGTNPKMHDLPLAIVNEDQGTLGSKIETKVTSTKSSAVKWAAVKSTHALNQKMDDQKYYGAIIIPKDFSQQLSTLATATPHRATVKVVINQGKSATVTAQVKTLLNTMVTKMSGMMGQQLTTQMTALMTKKAQATGQTATALPTATAQLLTNPIQVKNVTVHKTGKLAAGGGSFFTAIWLSSVIGAVLMFLAGRGARFTSKKQILGFRTNQFLMALGLSVLVGVTVPWYTTWILNYHFDHIGTMIGFLILTAFAFITLIMGVVDWLGFAGLGIFVLLLFFSMPLLQLVPEMLPSFYANWVLPWLPMKFLYDGTRNILFYGSGVWNTATANLLWCFLIGVVLHFASIFKPQRTH